MVGMGWLAAIGQSALLGRFKAMWKAAPYALLVACSPVSQESVRTVAAIEIALQTPADRADLLAMLRQQAATDPALHVDDVSRRWERLKSQTRRFPPEADGTIYVGIWARRK